MRLLHTSDWHIGRNLHGADLSAAHELFFASLQKLVEKYQVDAVLVSGDLFDRAIPAIASLRLAEKVISQLLAKTQVVIISGNHDHGERLGFLAKYLGHGLHLRTSLADLVNPVELELAHSATSSQAGQKVLIWTIPFLHPDWARSGLEELLPGINIPRSHQGVISAAMQLIGQARAKYYQQQPPAYEILMAHLFAQGGASADSERDISVGGIEVVDVATLAAGGNLQLPPLDYLALGHLHRPQQIQVKPLNSDSNPDLATANLQLSSPSSPRQADKQAAQSPLFPGAIFSDSTPSRQLGAGLESPTQIYYSGSPIPFSFSEAQQEKQVFLLELSSPLATAEALSSPSKPPQVSASFSEPSTRCRLQIQALPCPLYRRLSRLRDTFDNLLNGYEDQRQDWVEILVEDKVRPEQMIPRLKNAYPNALIIQHIPQSLTLSGIPKTPVLRQAQHQDVLASFFTAMLRQDLSSTQQDILKELVEEAENSCK